METQEVEDRDWGKINEQIQAEQEHMQAKTRDLEGIKEDINKITRRSEGIQEEVLEKKRDLKILSTQVDKMKQEVMIELD